MSHASEYGAFKNNSSTPFKKVAAGVEFAPTDVPVTDDSIGHEVAPSQPSTQLELGKIGISALRDDANGLEIINPHETENRADIAARLRELTLPYVQAARLALPSPEANRRGIFGGLKDTRASTPKSSVEYVIEGRRGKKVTHFSYEPGKDHNRLTAGYTTIEDYGISTSVSFDNDENAVYVTCQNPTRKSPPPEDLAPITDLKDKLNWTYSCFTIGFGLTSSDLGASMAFDTYFDDETVKEELIYNGKENTFNFRNNATIPSLSPEEFAELVAVCINFTPLEKH